MDEIREAVLAAAAAQQEQHAAWKVYAAAVDRVIEVARTAGTTERVVIPVGRLAWYVDPPGAAGNTGWTVTWGSHPDTEAGLRGIEPGEVA